MLGFDSQLAIFHMQPVHMENKDEHPLQRLLQKKKKKATWHKYVHATFQSFLTFYISVIFFYKF